MPLGRQLGTVSGLGTYETPSLPCAWAVIDATNGTIKQSFNISSVTNNASGDNTFNLLTAMPTANLYAIGACNGTTVGVTAFRDGSTSTDITASSVRAVATGGGVVDPQTTSTYYSLVIFTEAA